MPNPAVFRVVAEKVIDRCPMGYQEGDEFEIIGLRTPKGEFCGGAFHAIFPMLSALNFGVDFPFESEPGVIHTTCPDKGKVAFKTTRIGYVKELYPQEYARMNG